MPKYRCTGSVVGSKYLGVVEAKDAEEAKEKAFIELEPNVSLCHQCSSECEDGEIDEVFVEEIGDDEGDEE